LFGRRRPSFDSLYDEEDEEELLARMEAKKEAEEPAEEVERDELNVDLPTEVALNQPTTVEPELKKSEDETPSEDQPSDERVLTEDLAIEEVATREMSANLVVEDELATKYAHPTASNRTASSRLVDLSKDTEVEKSRGIKDVLIVVGAFIFYALS
jgi:hypothetical protein